MTELYQYLQKNNALIEISSFEECIEIFTKSGKLNSPYYYYRGHSDSSYRLSSTLDRFNEKEINNEQLLIQQFKKIAGNYFPFQSLPKTTFEWLSLMQHYGVPTRLVDLTHSPYIALYFAVNDYQNPFDAAVWAINPSILHEASIHKLKESKFTLTLDKFYGDHLPEFIQEEYFCETFMSGKYRVCLILEPEIAEKRLFQQQGAFLVSSCIGNDTEDILGEVTLDYIHLRKEKYEGGKDKGFWDWNLLKVVIPQKFKKKIFHQLLDMNINAATLFPDIYGAARYVTEYVKTSRLW
jgi:hypothetical protein